MAGFMSGFGSAFAQSFSQAQAQSANDRSDKFKLKYADYISKRDTRAKTNEENKKNLKLAKTIVEQTGQPAEAWGQAYEMLSSGAPYASVLKQYQDNAAVVTPRSQTGTPGSPADAAPADPRDDLTQGAQSSVDAQMTTSGMKPPENGGIFGNIKNVVSNTFGGNSEDRSMQMADRDTQKISGITGDRPEDINKTMSGSLEGDPIPGVDDYQISWKPKPAAFDYTKINNLNDALAYQVEMNEKGSDVEKARAKTLVETYQNAAAAAAKNRAIEMGVAGIEPTRAAIADGNGGWTGGFAHRVPDGSGNMVWKDKNNQIVDEKKLFPYTKGMEDDIAKQSEAMTKPLADYHQNVNNFLQMNRIAGKLSALADRVPQGTDLSGDVLQTIDRYKRAGINIYNTLTGAQPKDQDGNIVVSPSVLTRLDASEKEVEKELANPLKRVSDAALAATLMDIQATKLAYMYAASQGQTGKSVSANEFEAFKRSAMGNGNPEGLAISAADFLQDTYKSLKDQEAQLSTGSSASQNFQQRYNAPSPIQMGPKIDDVINGDPEVKSNFEKSKARLENNSLTQSKQTQGAVPEGMKAVGKTPDGKMVYEDENGERWIQ